MAGKSWDLNWQGRRWLAEKLILLERLARKIALEATNQLKLSELATPYPPASTPGSPPHSRTGTLRSSISQKIESDTLGVDIYIGVLAGPASEYAAALEFGTSSAGKNRSVRIEARPFLRPALEQMKKRTIRRLT